MIWLTCDLAQVEQLLEDKYLSMKYVKGWEEEQDDYALFASPAKKKGQKKTVQRMMCVKYIPSKDVRDRLPYLINQF